MAPMTAREVGNWTAPQRWLAGALVFLGLCLTAVTFTMIYFTVTHLLHPYMGDWAWTVVAAGEAAFLYLFLTGILLALRRAPGGAWRGVLMLALFAGSILLNVYGSRGVVPAAAGHVLIVVTFFGCILTGKQALLTLLGGKVRADRITFGEWLAHPVHSLRLCRWMVTWGEPSREKAHARYMALLFAVAVAQAAPGVGKTPFAWRRRLPVTLRYQLSTGLFPASLLAVIDSGGEWQPGVAGHVARELDLPHLSAPPSAPETVAGDVPGTAPESAPESVPQPRLSRAPEALPKLTAKRTRGMSPSALVPWGVELLERDPDVSLRHAASELHVGVAKASEVLRLARKDRLALAQ